MFLYADNVPVYRYIVVVSINMQTDDKMRMLEYSLKFSLLFRWLFKRWQHLKGSHLRLDSGATNADVEVHTYQAETFVTSKTVCLKNLYLHPPWF